MLDFHIERPKNEGMWRKHKDKFKGRLKKEVKKLQKVS